MDSLLALLLLLIGAIIFVPLAKRLGLGGIIGYLTAGMLIGESGLGLVGDAEQLLHVSEFGVVMLLFVIGLELKPQRLWVMRRAVFGLGGLQVVGTAGVLAGLAVAFGLPWPVAVTAGFGLALSSTAFVLPMLAERDLLPTQTGRDGLAILLLQDLAIIPLVALIPLMGSDAASLAGLADGDGLWRTLLELGGVVLIILLGGRLLVRPLFRLVDAAKMPEVFTATALALVIGVALLVQAVGLSMSLGAFAAGVLLADSEYRHELQADLEPFKGLLLGFFFTAVGMAADLGLLIERPGELALILALLVAVKAAVVFAVMRWIAKRDTVVSTRLAVALAQGGEFGFVLFGVALGAGLLASEQRDMLVLAVTGSMILTPILFTLHERLVAPRLDHRESRPFDRIEDQHPKVIVAGFGRFGQVIARVLRMRRIAFTALETSAAQVDFVRRFGNRVFYGDPTRAEVLRAAGAEEAEILIIAVDDAAASLKVVDMAQRQFPHLKLFVRARNRQHVYQLMDRGVDRIVRETFHSSLALSEDVLAALNLSPEEVRRTIDAFVAHDEQLLREQHAVHHDEKQLAQTSQQASRELQALFERDAKER